MFSILKRCSHCQQLAPTWKQLAEQQRGSDVKISHVDCTKSDSLCHRMNIKGYPTLLFIKNGKVVIILKGKFEAEFKQVKINYLRLPLMMA
jgi:thioredoxin-like negative regulator of GroEL